MILGCKFIPRNSFTSIIVPITKKVFKPDNLPSKPNYLNQYMSNEEIIIPETKFFLNQIVQFNDINFSYSQTLNLNTSILINSGDYQNFSIYEDIDIFIDNSKIKTYNYKLNILGNYNQFKRPLMSNYEYKNVKTDSIFNLENTFEDSLTNKLYKFINNKIIEELQRKN